MIELPPINSTDIIVSIIGALIFYLLIQSIIIPIRLVHNNQEINKIEWKIIELKKKYNEINNKYIEVNAKIESFENIIKDNLRK